MQEASQARQQHNESQHVTECVAQSAVEPFSRVKGGSTAFATADVQCALTGLLGISDPESDSFTAVCFAVEAEQTCADHLCVFLCCHHWEYAALAFCTVILCVAACFLDNVCMVSSGLSCCMQCCSECMQMTPACMAALYLAALVLSCTLMQSYEPAAAELRL